MKVLNIQSEQEQENMNRKELWLIVLDMITFPHSKSDSPKWLSKPKIPKKRRKKVEKMQHLEPQLSVGIVSIIVEVGNDVAAGIDDARRSVQPWQFVQLCTRSQLPTLWVGSLKCKVTHTHKYTQGERSSPKFKPDTTKKRHL